MKKVLLSAVCLFTVFISTQAIDKTSWQEYTGHYVLSFDNSEETVEITFREDSTLTVFSSLGQVALTYVKKDRFEVPQYGGVIIFERNKEQQVIACKISVAIIDMEEIKARKL